MRRFESMRGLGDNIYQRAFVKEYVRRYGCVHLNTPWPEIYEGIPNIFFYKPVTDLRTQNKNIDKQPESFWCKETWKKAQKIRYRANGIVVGMQNCFGFRATSFDLPPFPSPEEGIYAVIRPATIRREWPAGARNPLPEYLCECADILLSRGIKVISIADIDESEPAVEPIPNATKRFHSGELGIKGTLGLVSKASLVIGGIGWIVPAAIAYKVPSWFICGGWGTYNSPQNVTSAKIMDLSRTEFIVPDKFCMCNDANHDCDKRITNHAEKFTAFLGRCTDLVS